MDCSMQTFLIEFYKPFSALAGIEYALSAIKFIAIQITASLPTAPKWPDSPGW